ncbi:MAG: mechanosensitive ion channel family protein [Deltaproteobacteria bacterium]|nr:mechanosensitive ion channel family protein [Deltaproteobacteria bacterium]
MRPSRGAALIGSVLAMAAPATVWAAEGSTPSEGGLAAFLHAHVPEVLQRVGPFELFWWQWIALGLTAALAAVGGVLLRRLTLAVLARVVRRTSAGWDDALASRLPGPVWMAWTIGLAAFLVPWLELRSAADAWLGEVLVGALLVPAFWALYRGLDVVRDVVDDSPKVKERADIRTVIRLLTRVAKVFVLAVGLITLLAALGYPVAGLVAGLGLGGLALALAAQKTVENLFGSVSLGLDQPFRVGDFVRVEDFVGTVEAIGLRSTRIRTLDRTVITIPNGRLSEMRLESYTARDRMRLACTLGLTYSTTAEQLRRVLEGLEQVLRAHPKIWPDVVTVRFVALAASSLSVEVMAWFRTADWNEFQSIRQDVLLRFMEVVETAGARFAFPTQMVHLVDERGQEEQKPPMNTDRGGK